MIFKNMMTINRLKTAVCKWKQPSKPIAAYKPLIWRSIGITSTGVANNASANIPTSERKQLSEGDIKDVLIAEPQLQCLPVRKVKSYMLLLTQLGFPTTVAKNILVSIPRLIDIPKNEIEETLQAFKILKISESDLLRAIGYQHSLLLLSPNDVRTRMEELNGYFTKSDALELLECCPNVYVDAWTTITDKTRYIFFEMGFEQRDVIISDALKFSLEFIKLRHQTIVRSGRFQRPNPRNRASYKGIHLKTLLSLSDRKFLKFAGITSEEYVLFSEILEQESDEDEDSVS